MEYCHNFAFIFVMRIGLRIYLLTLFLPKGTDKGYKNILLYVHIHVHSCSNVIICCCCCCFVVWLTVVCVCVCSSVSSAEFASTNEPKWTIQVVRIINKRKVLLEYTCLILFIYFISATFLIDVDISDNNSSWLKCNLNQTGFYRVNYPSFIWKNLAVMLRDTPTEVGEIIFAENLLYK